MVKILTWPVIRSIYPFRSTHESMNARLECDMKKYRPTGLEMSQQDVYDIVSAKSKRWPGIPLVMTRDIFIYDISKCTKLISRMIKIKEHGYDIEKWDSKIQHYNDCIARLNSAIEILKTDENFQQQLDLYERSSRPYDHGSFSFECSY